LSAALCKAQALLWLWPALLIIKKASTQRVEAAVSAVPSPAYARTSFS
jgi:hypothetical protein